jgi:replicative DNA helicase
MNIENVIFENLIYNEDYARKCLPFLKTEYFTNKSDQIVFELIDEYVKKYNAFPTKEALEIDLSDKSGLNEEVYKNAKDNIRSIVVTDIIDVEWLLDKTEAFCKDKAIYNALIESIKIVDKKDDKISVGAIPKILSDALAVSFDTNIGHDFLEDSAGRYEFYHKKEVRIPFDLDYLNKITGGGLPRKTLNIILAGTGSGKSLAMCHMAAHNLTQGQNVLYITLEMSEEKIAERIDANLMDTPLDQLKEMSLESYEKKIERIKRKTTGKLIVKEYPTASAGSANFRYLLQELKLKKNFIPDVIYVDYLNICASSRIKAGANVNSYTYVKSIAEELRGLAVEFNVPLISATQTTRSGFCLALNTKVVCNGKEVNISDVKIGDTILSNIGNNIVTNVFPVLKKKLYKIKTESGKEIVCSEEHIFPTSESDKSLKTGLSIGDYLLTLK